MTITVMNRWTGNADIIKKAGALIGPIQMANGALLAQLHQIQNGPNAGQFLSVLQYPDRATWERIRGMMTTHDGFRAARTELLANATLEEQTVLIGIQSS